MKIIEADEIALHIGEWLKKKLSAGGSRMSKAVVGLSGGIDSGLVALICAYNGIPVICVNMPCHSSKESFIHARNLAHDYGLPMITVDATSASDLLRNQIENILPLEDPPSSQTRGNLSSCMRAPILDYVAKLTGGMILGTGNRDEDSILRYFSKRGDGAVDLSPIADLHKSEVVQMFEWIAGALTESDFCSKYYSSALTILEKPFTADLWPGQTDEGELGISYNDVEWVDEFVTSNFGKCADPLFNGNFWQLDELSQRAAVDTWVEQGPCPSRDKGKMIVRVAAIERSSRHKANPNIPVCEVHNRPEWFENINK